MGHRRRRQSQRQVEVSYRKQGETAVEAGTAAAAPAGRTNLPAERRGTWSRRTCSPAAFSISSRTPPTRRASSCPIRTASTGRASQRDARRSRCARARSRSRSPAARSFTSIRPTTRARRASRRSTASCAPTTTTAAAAIRRRRPAARQAGDTILVHAGLYTYHPEFYGPDRSINATTPYEGTYYLTASGTPDKPIVDQGRRRRRGDLRRQRQLQPVQRQGGQLQLFRRA